jgi:hypothetical protein
MCARFTFIVLVIGTILLSPFSNAEVEITINKTIYTYTTNPRLSDVLTPVAFQESWYWPSSQLFRSNTAQAQQLRQRILEILTAYSDKNDSSKSIYSAIAKQLKAWEIADRIDIEIDFDLARISPKKNPLVESGLYQLRLYKRPSHIHVFGALNNEIDLPYTNNTCVEEIMSKVTLSEYADKSFVYLISPKGRIKKSPIAYWNSKCTILVPGALVYVPLQEDLFSDEHEIINDKVLGLAINRMNIL